MESSVTVRPFEERDVERAGDVNFVAFYDVAMRHGMAPAVTTPADSRGYMRHLLSFDPLGGVVAEERGEVVGMGWVHSRGAVATIGPLAVDPGVQGRGIGRALLARCIEMAGPRAPQVRLVQESFNQTSLALYLRSGFRVVAPLLELELSPGHALVPPAPPPGVVVRPAESGDRMRLVERDGRAFGAQRPQSIDLYLSRGRALIAQRGPTPVGFAFGIAVRTVGYLGSASADDPDAVIAMLATLAAELGNQRIPLRTMVPAVDRRLVDGLIGLGFRVFRACHYMVRGGGTAPPPNYVLMNGDMM